MLADSTRRRHLEMIEKSLNNKKGSVELNEIQNNMTKKEATSLFMSCLFLKKANVIEISKRPRQKMNVYNVRSLF